MHFRPGTIFRGIEDVEYNPKFDNRNLSNLILFILLFKKIQKDMKIKIKNI